jgi:hypothetical protein
MLMFMALFMTLPLYTRTSEGEVHELGLGVRSYFHSARSVPLSEKRESIERACEGTSAEETARYATCGKSQLMRRGTLGYVIFLACRISLSYSLGCSIHHI